MLLLRKPNKEAKLKLHEVLSALVIGAMFFMSGCSSKVVHPENTGFFKDYEQFKKSADFNGSSLSVSSKADISKYESILISPVEVISSIAQEKQTPMQKKLYKEISDYLTDGYKREIAKSSKYKIAKTKGPNTMKLESAVSTVEVHFDDSKWNQFSPISMGVTVVSYNSYADEDVRLLGEKRLVDSMSGEVLFQSMNIMKEGEIVVESEDLEFKNIKPALDAWLEHIKNHFAK